MKKSGGQEKSNFLKKINPLPKFTYMKFILYMNYFIFLVLSLSLYLSSLGGCHKEEYFCLSDFKSLSYLYLKATECVISSVLTTIIIILVVHKLIHYLFIIPVVLIYLILFNVYQGYDLANHSSYNSLVFIIVFILSFLSFEYSYFIAKLIIRKQKKILVITIVVTAFPIFLFFVLGYSGCKNWDRGFNNVRIIDSKDKDLCYMRRPNFCTIGIFDNIFDLSRLKGSCKNKDNSQSTLKFYLKNFDFKSEQTLVYPNTRDYPFYPNSSVGIFHYLILNKIVDINDVKNDDNEIKVHYKNNKGTVEININPNKTLIEERKELAKKHKVKYENILFIYLDAISRNHFMRKLPKTSKLIEKYYHSKKDKNPKASSYQFLKYSNFRAATQNNIMPMFYGKSMKSSSGVSILKHLKNYGYITSGSLNQCHREVYDLQHYLDHNVKYEPFDHENFALFCDPNFSMPNYPFSYIKGIYSSFRRCLYGKDTAEYVLEYTQKFWDAYINERKYSRLSFIDAHEGTMEVVKYLDQHLFNFLNNFIEKYLNNNTTIFIVSDHGENMVSINTFFNGDDYFFEKSLGVFFLILPENSNLKINESNIIDNEQKFITPYDIHDTIIDIINGNEYSDNGISVFQKIDSLKRNCDSYNDDYDDKKRFCSCLNYRRK